MKCPYRIRAIEKNIGIGNEKEIIQEFGECYGEECPGVIVAEYFNVNKYTTKIIGCRKLKED